MRALPMWSLGLPARAVITLARVLNVAANSLALAPASRLPAAHPHPRCGSVRCSSSGDAGWRTITARSNPKIKLVAKLHVRRQRERSGKMLLEGHRLVLDALDAGLEPEFVLLHDAALEAAEGPRLREALRASGVAVHRVPAPLLAELTETQTPQGVLAVLPQAVAALPLPPSPSLVLVADGVAEPGNLGTLLRSAAGCGVEAALLSAGCSDAWGGKALRAGMGAQWRLPLRANLTWPQISEKLAGV